MLRIICILLSFLLGLPVFQSAPTPQNALSSNYILHAGGTTPNGKTGSNSLEAINYSYTNGERALEIDFCWTEDGHLVCVHDWDAYYAAALGKKCVTLAEFEEARHGTYGFTSLTLDHLCEWLNEHKDVTIITDIKENCVDGAKIIAEKYPKLKDNFCIQIYSMSDYDEVHALGFNRIILTLYQMSWQEKKDTAAIAEFAKANKLTGIAFSADLIDLIPDYIDGLLQSETPLYVHTVNEYSEQLRFFDMGIDGIYVDYKTTE